MFDFKLTIEILMLVIQIFTSLFLVSIAFTDRMQRMPKGHLFGVELMVVGMLWSSVHSIIFLLTGTKHISWLLPEMRYLTELGLFVIAVNTMIFLVNKKLILNDKK